MVLIGTPDSDSTIRGIRKYNSYINKDSAVDNMRVFAKYIKDVVPMVEVDISMFYVTRL